MNKHLQLPVDIELKHYPGQEVLLISFRREALRDWCLGLCLLQAGLIDTLVVTEERKKMTVKISFGTNPQINRIARATLRQDISQVELTRNGLDYLQHFFLTYYRDGAAEVGHLDLEAIDGDTGKKAIYITFLVSDSVPSVSPEEAERRLIR